MNIEMIEKFEIDDIFEMEEKKPYFAKCISDSDNYSYHEYYVIERDYNDNLKLYNTNIDVHSVIELSKFPL